MLLHSLTRRQPLFQKVICQCEHCQQQPPKVPGEIWRMCFSSCCRNHCHYHLCLHCEATSECGCFKESFVNPVVEVTYTHLIPFKYYKMLKEAPNGSISLTHKKCRILQDAEVHDLHNRSWALRSKRFGTAVLEIV